MPRISKTDYISNDNMQFFKIILNSASNKAKLGAIRWWNFAITMIMYSGAQNESVV